jgi:hypothetical protein
MNVAVCIDLDLDWVGVCVWCGVWSEEVFVCVCDYDRKSQRKCECITYLGKLRHVCVRRWPDRLFAFAERVAHEVWVEEAGNLEEAGKRRRFGSLSRFVITRPAGSSAEIPSMYDTRTT